MKVLWLSNNSPIMSSRKGGGGWFEAMAHELQNRNVELSFVFPAERNSNGKDEYGRKFFTFMQGKYSNPSTLKSSQVDYFIRLLRAIDPDIIHIWGTEYSHSLAMVLAAEQIHIDDKIVVHIQGLCNACAEVYEIGLPLRAILGMTLRDIITGNIRKQKKQFYKRGINEELIISKVKHIIGRTNWDYARTRMINPHSTYHYCGELIRDIFFDTKWKYSSCKKHSIFVSQCAYPIKGMHLLVQSIKQVVEKYPDTIVYVAGKDLTRKKSSFVEKLSISNYGRYIKKLIHRMELDNSIIFVGPLDAESMKHQYLQANVFVLPSLIENSPNSLAEAMIVGTPCIASYVGGIPDYIENGVTGFVYPSTDISLLAYRICEVFSMGDEIQSISENEWKYGREKFNVQQTIDELLLCYSRITDFSN